MPQGKELIMSYQFEILSSTSVKLVKALGTRIVRTQATFNKAQFTFSKAVTKTDQDQTTQRGQLAAIMRPYVRKLGEDRKAMHQLSKELKIAGIGEAIATKKVAKRTHDEKRTYDAFARAQSDAAKELGIGAHSTSRGFTLPRGLQGALETGTRKTLNTYPDCDFEYGVRVRRGSLILTVSRVA